MDVLQLFNGIMLLAFVMLAMRLVMHIDSWRSAVSALHLRWEREQRQASASGVTLVERQAVQASFERLVTNRPIRLFWLHLIPGVLAVGFALLLAWDQNDLGWTGLWLAVPFGLTALAIYGYGWTLISQANTKLAVISSTLYGPAPPRVKVRNIQTMEEGTPSE